jgi:hypothetical protein
MVFVGTTGGPESHCGNLDGAIPSTNIDATPIIAEKPYLVAQGDQFMLMKPRVETNKVGVTSGFSNADEIDFSEVYVATENDSAATMNAKLEEGLHLVLQPGIYNLDEPIVVNKPDTVVFGMGLVTLISAKGNACIEVANVDGVRISGILLQAGPENSDTLLKWGDESKYAGSSENPGVMQDVFARAGGPDTSEVMTTFMVKINSGNVIVDDTWLWRADHGQGGLVSDSANPVATGL